jgi:hypothetical protein
LKEHALSNLVVQFLARTGKFQWRGVQFSALNFTQLSSTAKVDELKSTVPDVENFRIKYG